MRMQRIIWFLILCGIVSAFFVFLFSLPQSVQKYGFETKELTPSFAEREKDMTENLRKKREKIRHLRDEIDETILRLDTLIGDYYDLT